MPSESEDRSREQRMVYLVDDHSIVRQGLMMLIDDEPDLKVCGDAESAHEALIGIGKLKPDVAVIDLSLGDANGIELIKQVHAMLPALPILALSMHDEAVYAERAVRAGARGYIMKREATEQVLTAIRRVLDGEVYLSEKISSRMLGKLLHAKKPEVVSPIETLSEREFQVFNLIARGVGPNEIAERLGLSVKTIQTHREHIKGKLGVKDRAELTRYALMWLTGHE